jgi:hypothetical protein
MVHGKRQNSENLGLLDVYTVEKMRERHGSGRPVPLKANGGEPNLDMNTSVTHGRPLNRVSLKWETSPKTD